MNKAIFLDRDGTINLDKGYVYRKEDFVYLPRVKEALRILSDKGYYLFVVTNQSGIARGYYTEEEFHTLNEWMINDLLKNGIKIHKVKYCPHHPEGCIDIYAKECECRKPKLGMYMSLLKEYNVNLSESYVIGDKLRDCELCFKSNCKGFLIGNNEKKTIIQRISNGEENNIKYCSDLYDCVMEILSGNKEKVSEMEDDKKI